MTHHTRSNGWAAAIVAACALALSGCGKEAEPSSDDAKKSDSAGQSSATPAPETRTLGDYELRIRDLAGEGGKGQRAELLRNGTVAWSRQSASFTIGGGREDARQSVGVHRDITGDGTPDLVLIDHSGGADCCSTFVLLSLGQQVEELAVIDAGRGEGAHFADLDRDGSFEFVGRDWTFSGWNAAPANSPAPRIVLSWNGAFYELAPGLMRTSAPSDAKFEELGLDMLGAPSWSRGKPPASYWAAALDFIYSGHRDAAERFLMLTWPDDVEGRDAFVAEFMRKLEESPYYLQLAQAEGGG